MTQGRILIVEDDVELAKVLRLYFTAQHYEVVVAHRGREALACCRRQLPDAIILDIKLPDMDGYEVLGALRADPDAGHIPFIILTQMDERSDQADGLKPGWDCYLTKPFEFAELNQCLQEAITRLGQQPVTPGTPAEAISPEEARDYANQLAEQLGLWETTPELAQTLIEVNRLTSSTIHDMSKIGALLDLATEATLSKETWATLQSHLWRCRLAYENLNWLRYKVRRYQRFQPVSLDQALARLLDWLGQAVVVDFKPDHDSLNRLVAMPELRLQQALGAFSQWLLSGRPDRLEISTRLTDDETTVIFRADKSPVAASNFVVALDKNIPGAVYGYIAQKIMTCYGGRIEMIGPEFMAKLPNPTAFVGELEALAPDIERRQARLEQLEQTSAPAVSNGAAAFVVTTAMDLIDPLARDLAANLEATREFLRAATEIDCNALPWSAIERNLRFFQLLATALQKEPPFQPASIQLDYFLERIPALLTHRLIDHEIVIVSTVAEPVLVSDETYLLQIFVHLALNALEAMAENGRLTFRLSQNNEGYIVEVSDDGSGIPADYLPERIFDLYVTTKGAGRGLGLYRVKKYVARLGGQIEVASEMGQGTTVTVKLPTTR